jgi:DNA-binding HxlR family transcriptional regulator
MDQHWQNAAAVIDVLGAKWVLRLLQGLESGPLRHNELLRAVSGIRSSTVLDDNLRRLEAAGLVQREVQLSATPPGVTYGLTSLGNSIPPLVAILSQWVVDHGEELGAFPAWQREHGPI